MRRLQKKHISDIRDCPPRITYTSLHLVQEHVASLSSKKGLSTLGMQWSLGVGTCQASWLCLHKLCKAMIRLGRERMEGVVEVDEAFIGGARKGEEAILTESSYIDGSRRQILQGFGACSETKSKKIG